MVRVQSEGQLFEIVGALDPPGCLAHRLDRGQEQADEHRDDRDDNQQLDKCKSRSACPSRMCSKRSSELPEVPHTLRESIPFRVRRC